MIFPEKGKRCIEITKELTKCHNHEPKGPGHRNMVMVLRGTIMGYELGEIQKFAVRNSQGSIPKELMVGHANHAKLGMADLLTQCRMFCFDNGWNFDDIQEMGMNHLIERQKEFQKDGWGEQ